MTSRPLVVGAVAVSALLIGVAFAGQNAPYHYASRYVQMRDGVRIAVDTYLPRDLQSGKRIPAILHQTRYYRALDVRWPASLFAEKFQLYSDRIRRFTAAGYAYVIVDVRGAGASFGTRQRSWSREEVDDAVELVDWIVAQSWSDGVVGAVGWSYDGIAAELLAARQHKALKAIAPQYAFFDGYRDASFPGGIHLTTMTKLFESVTIAMDQNRLGQFLGLPAQLMLKGVRPVDADKNHALLRAAIREHVGTERLHSDALRVEYRDDTIAGGLTADSLSSFVQAQALARSGVAIYNWSGWYDGAIVRSAIDRFNVVRAPGSRLILGPWTHAGSANLSPFAAGPRDFDADGELLRFFDFHLKGARNGLDTLPPVRYFTMGEEQWHSADSWPPPGARMVPYYLTAERGLAAGDANGQPDGRDSLALVLSGTGDHTRWNPLIGPGSSRAKIVDRAALDRALPGYGTSVLEEDVVITGQPIVSLQVSSTLEDGALFVYLDDVDPSGAVHGVSEGMLRLIHRGPATRACQNRVPPTHSFLRRDAAPMSVGRVEEVTFDLLPVSYLVRRGHRIRLSISGGDPDHFRQMSAPMQSVDISYGALNPSCVVLPVMPVAPNEHAE